MNKRWLVIGLTLVAMALFCGSAGASETGKHLFVLSGQSNMRKPLPDTFRQGVEAVFGKDKVIVVMVAHPGQPIKQWYKDWQPPAGMTDEKPEKNGHLYDRLLASVQRAIAGKEIATVSFIWMQGEADAGSGWGSVYAKSFQALLDQFKRDLEIEQINFVVGRINEFWLSKPDGKLMRSVLQELGEAHAHGDWINTDDLNTGVNPWGGFSFEDGHYPPPGYRVMGQRFAKKACVLIDPSLKGKVDKLIPEHPIFDEAVDIKTHAAVSKAVQLRVQPVTRHPGLNAGPAALVDGKFGQVDPGDRAWLAFKPSDQPIELVVDLGEPIEIDSIAVNTLLSSAAKAEFPNKFIYSTSLDGETYQVNGSRYNSIGFYNRKELGAMRNKGIEPTSILLLTEQRTRSGKPKARFIKVQIETGDQWVYLDEIVVNPVPKPAASTD